MITRFSQFSSLRCLLLRFGFDTKTTPFHPEELFLLSNILGIEAEKPGTATDFQIREGKMVKAVPEGFRTGEMAQRQQAFFANAGKSGDKP